MDTTRIILVFLLLILIFALFFWYYSYSFIHQQQLGAESYESKENLPKILILVISSSKSKRWSLEKEIWNQQIKRKFPNIDIFLVECLEQFTLKETCSESYIPGIYQKSLLSLQRFENYDFYVRTNLSTFFIFDFLVQKIVTLPTDKPIYTGYPWSWGVSGTGIIFNDRAKKLLLDIGLEKQYFQNKEVPDDVLISKVFQEQNVEKFNLPQILFTWDYKQNWYYNMSKIRNGHFPLCRMRYDKDASFQIDTMKKMLDCFKVLYIKNLVPYHYEIIESVLLKYSFILQKNLQYPIIYLQIKENKSFHDYIQTKYPFILFGPPITGFYDYCIDCSYYKNETKYVRDGRHFFISHNVFPDEVKKENIYFLTPLAKKRYLSLDHLPFLHEKKMNRKIPIYVIQGSIKSSRRDYSLLLSILNLSTKHPFQLKIIGKGDSLPDFLLPFQNKIIFKPNLDFEDYHKEFLECYCLLTLTSRVKTPHYYTNSLTSSINYSKGYQLYTILDKDLQDIYNLQNAFVFQEHHDIVNVFKTSLDYFYKEIVSSD